MKKETGDRVLRFCTNIRNFIEAVKRYLTKDVATSRALMKNF